MMRARQWLVGLGLCWGFKKNLRLAAGPGTQRQETSELPAYVAAAALTP